MVRFFSRWRRRRDPTPLPDSDESSEGDEYSDSGVSTTAATTDTCSSYTSSESEEESESDYDETDYEEETTASTRRSRSYTRTSATSGRSVTRSRSALRSPSSTGPNRSRASTANRRSSAIKSPNQNRPRSHSFHRHRSQSADSPSFKRDESRGRSRNRQIKNKENALNVPVRTSVISIRNTAALKEQGEKFQEMKNDPKLQTEWNKQFPPGTVVAYTDGSCFNNTASGFGVYFGPGHTLNRAERVDGPMHNSCLTEIIAAQRALTMLKQWSHYKNEAVIVRTDFLPLVQSMSKGVNRKATFAHYYLQLHTLAKSMPNGVQFQHVYGHGDDPGNQAADELARQAALSNTSRCRSSSVSCVRVKVNRIRGRSASRSNNRQHIRSHSAFVRGRA